MTETVPPVPVAWRAGSARPRTLADAVLHLIWQERRISRAEIARRANLSRSTVSEVATALLATRLVAEAGEGDSRGGRRPIVLEFQDDACAILGVDIGATHVGVVLTNLRGQVLAWEHRDHPVRSDPTGTLALVSEFGRACLRAWGGKRQRLVGLGVAVPSPVDPRHPDRFSPIAMPQWRGQSSFEDLRREFGVPILVDNDANLGALAEHWWGAGRGLDDFAYIKVATGIGLGHLIAGRIYRGSSGVAGEIGHLTVDPRGEPCVCGNRGCLATFVGTQALVALATRLLADYPGTVLRAGEITITAIEDAALVDDPLALQVVRTAAESLGIAVAGLLNLNNPAAVILGGGLSRLEDRLLTPLRETVLRRTFVSAVAASEILTSQLGPRGIAIGAATLVLDAALTDPTLFPTIGAR
ncbi:MAG: ROK family transcriptional regulator [Gemmatimonadota bacterium]|nr:ROK family transcriptional regulator [Gemmatimonadota bacterium]